MIPTELKKLLGALQECDVRYLLADGFTHSPAATLKLSRNIDFWLNPSLDNARRLIRALKIFGTPMHGIQPERLATLETQFSLQCRPHQLDFHTHIPNLDFEKSSLTREIYREGRLLVSLLSPADLVQARASISRPPDSSDPDMIE
jgi:hypothetical protein